jgi:hypothetical protein
MCVYLVEICMIIVCILVEIDVCILDEIVCVNLVEIQ